MLIDDVNRLYEENLKKLATIIYIRQDGRRVKPFVVVEWVYSPLGRGRPYGTYLVELQRIDRENFPMFIRPEPIVKHICCVCRSVKAHVPPYSEIEIRAYLHKR